MKRFQFFVVILTVALLLSACGAPAPTAAPAAEQPAAQQPAAVPSGSPISYSGVAFVIPTGLGSGAQGIVIPEVQAAADGPDQGNPAYLKFDLQGYPISDGFSPARVEVAYANARIGILRGDVNAVNAILAAPNMPLTWNVMPNGDGYLRRAFNMKTLSSADMGVKGVRMLAVYGQDVAPIANDGSFAYYFHGLTADGKLYVIVKLPITLPSATELPALTYENIEAYYQQAEALLNAAEAAGSLSPSIAAMDAFAQSLTINSATVGMALPSALPTLEAVAPATVPPVAACQDKAYLEADSPKDYPDDAGKFNAGATFTKKWTLKNTGTCTWDPSYKLAFVEGIQLANGPEVKPLVNNTIPPGVSLTIEVPMRAPEAAGTEYLSKWSWKDGAGNVVRIGYAGGDTGVITVKIFTRKAGGDTGGGNAGGGAVPTAIPPGMVTSLSVLVDHVGGTRCGDDATYVARVYVETSGSVIEGYTLNVVNGNFEESGGPTVQDQWNFGGPPTQDVIEFNIVGPYSSPGSSITVVATLSGGLNHSNTFTCP